MRQYVPIAMVAINSLAMGYFVASEQFVASVVAFVLVAIWAERIWRDVK